MRKSGIFTKILAITGSILVSFPVLAPLIFGLLAFIVERRFRFDYLMPAELFLFALAGGIMLLWAALRAHARVKHIAWSLGLAVVLPVLGQVIAVLTGLASGAAEPVGWKWILVLAFLVLYDLMLIALAVGGFLMVRDLFLSQNIKVSSD